MNEERQLKCTILGSFRFKTEIDRTREELEDNGVEVLAPEKGQVFSPPAQRQIRVTSTFKPLPSERKTPIRSVEDMFLESIKDSDFVYVVDIDGYVGTVVSMEMGVAIASGKPVYIKEAIDLRLDSDPDWRSRMSGIKVLSATDAVTNFISGLK